MQPDVMVGVLYSCSLCGLKDIEVKVQARGTEDLMIWMKTLIRSLVPDHQRRSPLCRAQEFSEVKIPMTGTDRVGGAASN